MQEEEVQRFCKAWELRRLAQAFSPKSQKPFGYFKMIIKLNDPSGRDPEHDVNLEINPVFVFLGLTP
jgi:hypothetical protein